MDVDGAWKPARKDTTILTTKRSVAETMNRLCSGDHEHCRLEGYMKGHGTHRTSFMEEYQPAFASTPGTSLACSEKPQLWEGSFAVREQSQYLGKIVDLHAECLKAERFDGHANCCSHLRQSSSSGVDFP